MDFRFKPQDSWVNQAPCPAVLDPTALAAAVWDRSPGTWWQLSWEVMGHGENAGAEGHQAAGCWAQGAGQTVVLSSSWQCQAQWGSTGIGLVAGIYAQGTWQRRRRRISKKSFELHTNEGPAREVTPTGIKYDVPVPEA